VFGVRTRSGLLRRWLLVLVLAAGLIGMHHLIAGHPDALAGATQPVAASAMVAMGPVVASGAAASTGIRPVAGRAATPGQDGPGFAVAPSARISGPGPVMNMPVMDMLMHACLAVLAALSVLALAAAVGLLTLSRPADDRARPRPAVPHWARPPPRTAVRLAQLCVLRN